MIQIIGQLPAFLFREVFYEQSYYRLFVVLIVVSVLASSSTAKVRFDFDGDGKTDPTVLRNAASQEFWHILGTANGYSVTAWRYHDLENLTTDWAAAADYDGDGKADVAVWREPTPGGDQAYFHILYSRTGTYSIIPWGRSRNNNFEDYPVRGDFDGDNREDVAIARQIIGPPGGNYFYILQSRDSLRIERFGNTGDLGAAGDYGGDGRTDLTAVRAQCPVAGCKWDFYVKRSSDASWRFASFGFYTSDNPLSHVDFDGDGKSDIAVWSGEFGAGTGRWSWIRSSDGQVESFRWGFNSSIDTPAQGDYDGDGKTDVAIYRRNTLGDCAVPSYFWILGSTMGVRIIQFGSCHDHPSISE